MEPQMPVDQQSPPSRLANFWSSVRQTRLMISQTTNRALRMLPFGLGNCPAPPELPTTEMKTLFPPPQRPVPSTSFFKRMVERGSKSVYVTAVVFLSLLLVFVFVYRQAVIFMKWMYTDESDELYNKQLRTKPVEKTNKTKQSMKCVVPAYPEHGEYVIPNASIATPGDSFESLRLVVNCLHEYEVLGPKMVFCVEGSWSEIPKCVRFCKLDKHASVRYHCLVTDPVEGRRDCNAYEPSGTVVEPECSSPIYFSANTLSSMRCINGSWDHVVICSTECGRVTSNGVALMTNSRSAEQGELPWHVGIYRRKTKRRYEQICGGSLVSNSVVISAAHCFWDDLKKQLPAFRFAVTAGNIYRSWNNSANENAQRSNVKEINIPAYFQGNAANFQNDIAVLILESPFKYLPLVRPVCLSFDFNFETKQLQHGKLGKVAGWGLTAENGNASEILKVVDLPYVDIEQCFEASPPSFRGHITGDKICAGYGNGTALCRGDSGGGLVFPDADRYYLQGIVSTAPTNENLCNIYALNTFTQILPHEHFIKGYL